MFRDSNSDCGRLSGEDWLAHLVELPAVSAFGPSTEKALMELDVAWMAAKESYAARGVEIPSAPRR